MFIPVIPSPVHTKHPRSTKPCFIHVEKNYPHSIGIMVLVVFFCMNGGWDSSSTGSSPIVNGMMSISSSHCRGWWSWDENSWLSTEKHGKTLIFHLEILEIPSPEYIFFGWDELNINHVLVDHRIFFHECPPNIFDGFIQPWLDLPAMFERATCSRGPRCHTSCLKAPSACAGTRPWPLGRSRRRALVKGKICQLRIDQLWFYGYFMK